MTVNWVRPRVQWVGNVKPKRAIGVSAGGVSVATSGIIAPLLVVGILALAVYGGVKAVGKLPAGR